MTKINWYIFIQILKSCTLIFFIFTSIAWLLQLSRLFSFMNNLQIDFSKILHLSTYMLPNIINITLPFVLIFGFTLSFIKLDKDKELIAIYSLGLSLKQLVKPLILISFLFILIYLILNLFLSPYLYDKYKKKEFELRNIINIKNINFSNFIELDKNLVIDFSKNGKNFIDIFINYENTDGDNLIFSKNGNIISKENKYIFDLNDGYKLSILNQEIEKLEFENYKIEFLINKNITYDNIDTNTLTIIDLFKEKDLIKINEKIFDTLLLITLMIFFYFYLIKNNNYSFKNISIYLILSIIILITHNILKNLNFNFNFILYLNLINLSIIYFFIVINKKIL